MDDITEALQVLSSVSNFESYGITHLITSEPLKSLLPQYSDFEASEKYQAIYPVPGRRKYGWLDGPLPVTRIEQRRSCEGLACGSRT